MKLYLGLLEGSLPYQTRIFLELDDRLVDLNLACTAYLTEVKARRSMLTSSRPAIFRIPLRDSSSGANRP